MKRLIFVVVGVMLWAGPVIAQEYEVPNPTPLEPSGTAIDWLITAGFLIGCLIVAFLPAKRSNLK